MIRLLIILGLFGWAGCTQQEEPSPEVLAMYKAGYESVKPTPPDTIRFLGVPKQDTVRLIYTFVVGDDHIMRQINPPLIPAPPCLYSTEYEVCQVRGHDEYSVGLVLGGYGHFKCHWCGGSYKKSPTIEEVSPPTK